MAQPHVSPARGTLPSFALSLARGLSLAVAAAVALAPADLRAEAQPLTNFHGGGLYLTTESPTLASDGNLIDCAITTPGCFPLNRAACSGRALPIRFALGQPLSQSPPNYLGGTQTVYAYLSTTPGCIYSSNNAQIAANGNLIGSAPGLPSSSVFFANGFNSFAFPTDLSALQPNVTSDANSKRFTTRDLLRLLNVCPEDGGTPVDLTQYYLCVGVDGTGNKGGVNNGTAATSSSTNAQATGTAEQQTGSGGDLFGFMALQVDTKPPAGPLSMRVVPKNGRAEVSVSYDASPLDVDSVRLHYTADAGDLAAGRALDANGQASGCGAWRAGQERTINVKGNPDGNNLRFAVDGLENGVPYAFCATTRDFLRNESTPTAEQTAMPRHECDLFACSGDTLQVGFCAGQDLPPLWGAALMGCAWAWRRRQRRAAGRAAGLPPWACLCLGLGLGTALLSPRGAAADDLPPERDPPHLEDEPPPAVQPARPVGERSDEPPSVTLSRRPPNAFSGGLSDGLSYGPKRPLAPVWSLELAAGPFGPPVAHGRAGELYRLIYAHGGRGPFAHRPTRLRLAGWWTPFRHLRSGPVASLGLWHTGGHTRVCGTEAAPADCTADTVLTGSRAGNDTAGLWLIPVAAGWQHELPLGRWLKAPVSVAARAGLVANVWWATSGAGAARVAGRRAQGLSTTAELSARVVLDLSELTRARSRETVHGELYAEASYLPGRPLFGRHPGKRLDFGMPAFVTVGVRGTFFR